MKIISPNDCYDSRGKWTGPEVYLHVQECRSGECWVVPLTMRTRLDLKHWVKRWVKEYFGGEFRLSGKVMSRIDGDFYAAIMTDSRPPDSGVCWMSGGFYVEST